MTAPATTFWLEYVDDPLALAGTGRRVGTFDACKTLVSARYPGAVFEGPY